MINRFICSLKSKQMDILYKFINDTKYIAMYDRIIHMIKDLLYYILYDDTRNNRNTNIQKCLPDLRNQLGKGVELLKLENIIHSDIYEDFKPCILYTYDSPVRNMIFNYNDTLDNISDYDNIQCNCTNSDYCNGKVGHVYR